MKVLFLTRNFGTSESTGGTAYSKQVIDLLVSVNFDVTVVSCNSAAELEAHLPFQIFQYSPQSSGRTLKSRLALPKAAFYCSGPDANKAIAAAFSAAKLLRAIVFDHVAMLWAVDLIRQLDPDRRLKLIYVAHNDEIKTRFRIARIEIRNPLESIMQAFEGIRTAMLIDRVQHAIDAVVLIAPGEASQSGRFGNSRRFYFPPHIGRLQRQEYAPQFRNNFRGHVLHYGSLTWKPKYRNLVRFLREWHRSGAAEHLDLTVAGYMAPAVQKGLEKQYGFAKFISNISVSDLIAGHSFTAGVVIDDAGGGFKMKILDYVGAHLPVFALSEAIQEGMSSDQIDAFERFNSLTALVSGLVKAHQHPQRLQAISEKISKAIAPLVSGAIAREQVAAMRQWLLTSR